MTINWKMAPALEQLRAQINEKWPRRSKVSDGGVGDLRHQHHHSDHNPEDLTPSVKNDPEIVLARDFTNDPLNGPSARKLAEALILSGDKRIAYVISNRQICSGPSGKQPGVWRKYTGTNPHEHHMHLSITAKGYKDVTPWDLSHYGERM